MMSDTIASGPRAPSRPIFITTVVVASAVLFGLRLLFNLPVLLGGRVPLVEAILSVVTTALTIAAAIQLFAPDARVWFGERPASAGEEKEA